MTAALAAVAFVLVLAFGPGLARRWRAWRGDREWRELERRLSSRPRVPLIDGDDVHEDPPDRQ